MEVGRRLLAPEPRPLPPLALAPWTRPAGTQNEPQLELATSVSVILPETGQFLLLCSLQAKPERLCFFVILVTCQRRRIAAISAANHQSGAEDGCYREKFRNFVAWAEPDPKTAFFAFLGCSGQRGNVVRRWKVLLRCVCSAAREALGRPRGGEGRGILCRHAHSSFEIFSV